MNTTKNITIGAIFGILTLTLLGGGASAEPSECDKLLVDHVTTARGNNSFYSVVVEIPNLNTTGTCELSPDGQAQIYSFSETDAPSVTVSGISQSPTVSIADSHKSYKVKEITVKNYKTESPEFEFTAFRVKNHPRDDIRITRVKRNPEGKVIVEFFGSASNASNLVERNKSE